MYKYSMDNKRYYTLNYYLTRKFKTRVFKVSLNGNFSCPNFKNGSGCIFCSAKGSGDFAGNKEDDLLTQFNSVKEKLNNKWPDTKYIAYFQANTNTYAPVSVLKKKFEEVLHFKNVVGISIGTRPDCINNECLEYLKDLNKRTHLMVELGLQSMHNNTLKLINRGHDLKCFDTCVKKLKDNNINVVVHIINGLPNEDKDMMIDTVKHLNKLNIDGIKIHMLHILKNTELENYYKKNKFHILTKEEYVDIVCCQIEELNENIVVHRLTGDGKKEDLVAPFWTLKKVSVLNDIDKELKRRGTYQGFKKSLINLVNLKFNKIVKNKDILINESNITFDYKENKIYKLSEINETLNDKISLIILDYRNKNKKLDIYKYIKLLNKKGIILILLNLYDYDTICKTLKNISIEYKTYKNSYEDYLVIEIKKQII